MLHRYYRLGVKLVALYVLCWVDWVGLYMEMEKLIWQGCQLELGGGGQSPQALRANGNMATHHLCACTNALRQEFHPQISS